MIASGFGFVATEGSFLKLTSGCELGGLKLWCGRGLPSRDPIWNGDH